MADSYLKSHQFTHRSEVEIEVFGSDAELLSDVTDRPLETHECCTDRVDFLWGECSPLHPANGLALHQPSEEFNQRQHQLSNGSLYLLGLRIPAQRLGGGPGP